MSPLQRIGRWLAGDAPPAPERREPTLPARKLSATRSYGGAMFGRLVDDWIATGTSFDAELKMSLRTLRNRSRQLVRDNEYAKQAMRLIKNNVIGQGVGLQAQVMMRSGRKLDQRANDLIEREWATWCRMDSCHAGGTLSFAELQRLLMGAVAESGDVLVRKVHGRQFGRSRVPFALEIIEADQLVEEWSGRAENGNEVRMGVEVDAWHRPVAYWLYPKHPGDSAFIATQVQSNRYLRVPADEIYHLFVPERPGATRGVPWMHAGMKTVRDIGGYKEAEIVAARADASVVGFVQSQEVSDPDAVPSAPGAAGTDGLQNGERVFDMEAGTIKELAPGETFNPWHPTRPNGAIDPFLRVMLRGFFVGVGIAYDSGSGDFSQSNYSSARLARLDERDNWRSLQRWFVDHFLQRVFEDWLSMAVLSGVVAAPDYELNPARWECVRWITRGWSYIDPTKEVAAAKEAIRAGLSTQTDECAAKGDDFEELAMRRKRELELAEKLGLVFDTDPRQVNDKGAAQPAAPAEGKPEGGQPGDGKTGGEGEGGEPPDDDAAESGTTGAD